MIKPDAKEQGEFQITCHQATNQAMNYLHGLHAEIKRLEGVAPSLDIDEDEIARAIITRMVQGKRFMVNLDYWNNNLNVIMVDQKSGWCRVMISPKSSLTLQVCQKMCYQVSSKRHLSVVA